MRLVAYLLAIICIIAAVMYFAMPAGQLPTFMPGYEAGSAHIHMKHADHRGRCGRGPVPDRLAGRPPELLVGAVSVSALTLRCTRSSNRLTLTTTRWWVPPPIASTVSRASTWKVMVRPSTRTTSAVAVTCKPTGVAAT